MKHYQFPDHSLIVKSEDYMNLVLQISQVRSRNQELIEALKTSRIALEYIKIRFGSVKQVEDAILALDKQIGEL